MTVFRNAIKAHDIGFVKKLIADGYEVNKKGRGGSTALHTAARSGSHEIVSILIQSGANGNMRNFQGMTALDIAKKLCRKSVAKML